jgi:hypothetical protein
VRAHLRELPLWTSDGLRVDVRAALARAAAGETVDDPVEVRDGDTRVRARLVLRALPPDQAERSRAATQKRIRSKKKRAAQPWTLELAGYVCLVTTLPDAVAGTEAVLQWYRVRWQVELFFKRCKSLLNLHAIQSHCPQLQRVRLLACLLVAVLVERLNGTRCVGDEETGYEEEGIEGLKQARSSVWRLTQVHALDLLLALAQGPSLKERLARRAETDACLQERPRKRDATRTVTWLQALEKQRCAASLAA